MTDITRFNSFEELSIYYNELKKDYDRLSEIINIINDDIITNSDYLLEISQEFIDKVNKKTPSIFKQHDLINNERYKYVDYLLEEFHNSEIYLTYLYITYEIEQINLILSAIYTNDNLPKETVDKINEFIFEEYKVMNRTLER